MINAIIYSVLIFSERENSNRDFNSDVGCPSRQQQSVGKGVQCFVICCLIVHVADRYIALPTK